MSVRVYPLAVARELAGLFDPSTRWWVCGGGALQLHLRRQWRPLGDVDVAVFGPATSLRLPAGVEVDVSISPGNKEHWICRRDPGFRVPWGEAVLRGENDVPYLAPDLVLLSKSRRMAPVDLLDAAVALAALTPRQAARFASRLPADHPWADALRNPRTAR